MDKAKAAVIAVVSALMSWLGILAVPVFLLVGCNILDYITGLMAAPYRNPEDLHPVKSYKSIKGIIKKVCMWILVLVGAWFDVLINYSIHSAGVEITIPFVVSTVVAVWLVVNELISIMENIDDIGVEIPPFLMPVMKYVRRTVEEKATLNTDEIQTAAEIEAEEKQKH